MDGNHQLLCHNNPSCRMIALLVSVAVVALTVWSNGPSEPMGAPSPRLGGQQLRHLTSLRYEVDTFASLAPHEFVIADPQWLTSPLPEVQQAASQPAELLSVVDLARDTCPAGCLVAQPESLQQSVNFSTLAAAAVRGIRPLGTSPRQLLHVWSHRQPSDWFGIAERRTPAIGQPVRVGWGDRLAMRVPTPATAHTAVPTGVPSVYSLFDQVPLTLTAPFPRSSRLEQQLAQLAYQPALTLWAGDTLSVLRRLTDSQHHRDYSPREQLTQLVALAGEADVMADTLGSCELGVQLRQVRWSLLRRAGCWGAVDDLRRPRHLLVAGGDQTRQAAASGIDHPLLVQYRETATVAPHASHNDVAELLEQFESTGDLRLARQVAARWQLAAASSDFRERALAAQIDNHYRNANLRVAISRDMLDRLIEPRQTRTEDVNDFIAGAPVHGVATSTSQLAVELLPDNAAWRLGLRVTGETRSRTRSQSPPVVVDTSGLTRFAASKQLLVDRDGLRTSSTRATADASSQLLAIGSRFDGVPLAGRFVQSRAVDEFNRRQGQAKREIEMKASDRVSSALDHQIDAALERARQHYQDHVDARLARLDNQLQTIELATTPERLVGRFRVARPDQLAAHTPRPRALADSLASLQMHESLATNLAAGIALDGQRLSVGELQSLLDAKFPGRVHQSTQADDIDQQATVIEFAEHDAVVVRFVEGQVRLQVSVAEIKHQRVAHRDFLVHVYFKPVVSGMSAHLAYAGGPYIEGDLRNAERFRLQGILGRVVDKDLQIPLLPESDNPRLSDLAIAQIVIDDGWLGWSIAPSTRGSSTGGSASAQQPPVTVRR
jgi:hypothetical protein